MIVFIYSIVMLVLGIITILKKRKNGDLELLGVSLRDYVLVFTATIVIVYMTWLIPSLRTVFQNMDAAFEHLQVNIFGFALQSNSFSFGLTTFFEGIIIITTFLVVFDSRQLEIVENKSEPLETTEERKNTTLDNSELTESIKDDVSLTSMLDRTRTIGNGLYDSMLSDEEVAQAENYLHVYDFVTNGVWVLSNDEHIDVINELFNKQYEVFGDIQLYNLTDGEPQWLEE